MRKYIPQSIRKIKESCSLVIFFIFIFIYYFAGAGFAFDHCFEKAGNEFEINPLLLWTIAKVESNFNQYAINKNKNGTYDYGVMQINSSWYKVLGHKNWMNLSDPCYNIMVGAWILRQCMDKYGYSWDAIACYNAGDPRKGKPYTWKIYNTLKEIGYKNPAIPSGKRSSYKNLSKSKKLIQIYEMDQP